jgi:hypothetical protein
VRLLEVVQARHGVAHSAEGPVKKSPHIIVPSLLGLEDKPRRVRRSFTNGTTIATVPLATTLMIATAPATAR